VGAVVGERHRRCQYEGTGFKARETAKAIRNHPKDNSGTGWHDSEGLSPRCFQRCLRLLLTPFLFPSARYLVPKRRHSATSLYPCGFPAILTTPQNRLVASLKSPAAPLFMRVVASVASFFDRERERGGRRFVYESTSLGYKSAPVSSLSCESKRARLHSPRR
jgi:hypothetical protein